MTVVQIGTFAMAASLGAGDNIRVALLQTRDGGPTKGFSEAGAWEISLAQAGLFLAELASAVASAGQFVAEQSAALTTRYAEERTHGPESAIDDNMES